MSCVASDITELFHASKKNAQREIIPIVYNDELKNESDVLQIIPRDGTSNSTLQNSESLGDSSTPYECPVITVSHVEFKSENLEQSAPAMRPWRNYAAGSEFYGPDVFARTAAAEARRKANRSTGSQRLPTATAGTYYMGVTPLRTSPSSDDEQDAQVNMWAHVHYVSACRTQPFGSISPPLVSPQMSPQPSQPRPNDDGAVFAASRAWPDADNGTIVILDSRIYSNYSHRIIFTTAPRTISYCYCQRNDGCSRVNAEDLE